MLHRAISWHKCIRIDCFDVGAAQIILNSVVHATAYGMMNIHCIALSQIQSCAFAELCELTDCSKYTARDEYMQ